MKVYIKNVIIIIITLSLVLSTGAIPGYSQSSQANRKFVYLYTGKRNATEFYGKYYFSDVSGRMNLSKLTENNEFVISPTGVDSSVYELSSTSNKNNIKPLIKSSYDELNSDKYDGVVDLARKIYDNDHNAKIWIGTPIFGKREQGVVTSYYQEARYDQFLSILKYYIDQVKKELGSIWDNNVQGIYMTDEVLYCYYRFSNINSVGKYKEVKLFTDLSKYIRNPISSDPKKTGLSKKFLWCPFFYAEADDAWTPKEIAYVAEQTDIFDYILLQPTYYQSPERKPLAAVYYSVLNQKICDNNNKPVSTLKKSSKAKAIIGVQMELNAGANDSVKRYDNIGRVIDNNGQVITNAKDDSGNLIDNSALLNYDSTPPFNTSDDSKYNYAYVFYSLLHSNKLKYPDGTNIPRIFSFYADQSWHLSQVYYKVNAFFKSYNNW